MACRQFRAVLFDEHDESHAILCIIRQAGALSTRAFHRRSTERGHELYCNGSRHCLLPDHVQSG